MEQTNDRFAYCPYLTAQRLFSGKWALMILCYLRRGPLRFGELMHFIGSVADVTQATLTSNLRRLEQYGLIIRTVYPEVPPRVDYRLSEIGERINPLLDAIGDFGMQYIGYMGRTDELCAEALSETCRCMYPIEDK